MGQTGNAPDHSTARRGVPHLSVNDALLLIGHGSVRYPDAGSALQRHANTLRLANRYARVEVALLNGTPSVSEALACINTPTIRVVPFFMEVGYFTRVAVPRAIQTVMAGAGSPSTPLPESALPDAGAGPAPTTQRSNPVPPSRILMRPPVGIHDGMAALIERQALAACVAEATPFRDAAVLIVGHGSSSSPGQALALHRHAARLAATELFARVEAACLEEPPFVADALSALRAHPVAVIGFFANHGGHVRDDVPALIAAEQAMRGPLGHAARFHGCVADDPMMVQIIMDQAASDPEGE
jgi:sirohydrochlorin cobaltochelatase